MIRIVVVFLPMRESVRCSGLQLTTLIENMNGVRVGVRLCKFSTIVLIH